MVNFNNEKDDDSLTINVTHKTPSTEAKELSFTYSRTYLESVKFSVHICKKHLYGYITNRFGKISKQERCRVINHVVASINDYKRYIDDKQGNKNK